MFLSSTIYDPSFLLIFLFQNVCSPTILSEWKISRVCIFAVSLSRELRELLAMTNNSVMQLLSREPRVSTAPQANFVFDNYWS